MKRVIDRYGVKPGEWHSGVKKTERFRLYNAIARNDIQLVIGARSALFLPFVDLGLIVVDEAHHVPAPTYSEVVNYFKPSFLIGLTATPYRTDNLDVLNYFGGKDGTIGKTAIVRNLPYEASLNSGVMLVRSRKNEFLSEYLLWVIKSRIFV